MNNSNRSYRRNASQRSRGSTLLVVLGFAILLGLFLAGVMNRGQTEQRLTDRNLRFHEALNAAESIGNYGIAEVVRRYTTRAVLPANEFSTNPLTIPDTGFFDDTGIVESFNELVGGIIGATVRTYVPDDSAHANDPLKGSIVDSVDVNLYSRAAAIPALMADHPAAAFLENTLQVRYVNLTDALFYNMDLELHPGPNMDFRGKVHTNADLYVMAGDGCALRFFNTVTAAGRILHLYKLTQQQGPSHKGEVFFCDSRDPTVTFTTMRYGGGNTNGSWVYNREGAPDWLTESNRRWNGYVQDIAHLVPTRNPAGIPNYQEDDPSTPANELQNGAYAVIEPLLPAGHADRKSTAGRHQKFHARACLVFQVEVLPASDPRYNASVGGIYVSAYTWDRVNPNIPINSQSPFDGNMRLDANGDPIKVPVYVPPGLIGAMRSDGNHANRTVQYYDTTSGSVTNMVTRTYIDAAGDQIPEVYATSAGNVTRGMRELRQLLDLSPITLDVRRLRELVDERAHDTRTAAKMGDFWIAPTDPTRTVTFDPQRQWNGVVYVEFPVIPSAPRSDNIVSADVIGVGPQNLNLSLQVVHGETIPNAPISTDSTVGPNSRYANPNPGFTIATNAPMYLIGNFNSDGNSATGRSDEVDTWVDAKGRSYLECPAGLACDSFTILSRNWVPGAQDLDGNGSSDFGGFVHNRLRSNSTNVGTRNAGYTEISASVITGLIPTIPGSTAISGGAHNFPRFLEKWTNNVPLRLRTSLNALFESEAHLRPMPANGGGYYDPPMRDWGQPDILANPFLSRIPPGWIQVLDFRMGGIRGLSYADYESIVAPLR